ncbi:Xanthine dehydrogenase, molybdenum binding subunit [hydrothermal vent metagenome]|uniref:Xanthine dehydrogenase, molybdenum binding subunit n=1 Tax=hydrothermal vent metagenome TaxID=652676 RepID=A0A3B0RUC2_9ZZZZ
MADNPRPIRGDVHSTLRHDSAHKHVAGNARYIDDLPERRDLLHVCLGQSSRAHAWIKSINLDAVRAAPGVVMVIDASDIPGKNDVSPFAGDDPLFAEDIVQFHGQSIFAVAAESRAQARRAARLAEIDYEDYPAILTIDDAMAAQSYIEAPQIMAQGDAETALDTAPHRHSGCFHIGGQDHFYLEGQIAMAEPKEDGDIHIWSSTQNPTETQHLVAHVLNVPNNAVTVELRRMGGGFGGKETHPSLFAAAVALIARKTGRAAKCRLDRDDDMIMTGKRHDFRIDYDVGFDDQGRLSGLDLTLASRCGYSVDLSPAINDRAMFHADNCYFLENVTITSYRCRTNSVSNTAFRGFGAPQGMIAIERIMDVIAHSLAMDPLQVRKVNLYGRDSRNITPYGMVIEDNIAPELIDELEKQSDYQARRAAISDFNATSKYLKKAIALTPVKFGISFTLLHLNQAGALLHIYSDGSVHLNHGGTEMGQGLFTKVAQVVANEFQIDIDRIKISATTTDKVPNTSPTAASSGSDLNGMAALAAAQTLKGRLIAFAAEYYDCSPADIGFRNNHVYLAGREISFNELVHKAYLGRVSLSSTGFYKTPKIHYDRSRHKGRPFFYFSYGAAVAEVIIDCLTGENKILRVDILHDVGRSLNPAIDRGQIEGGFIQGAGWLTTEELVFDNRGILQTHAPSTYKIPTCGDRPEQLNITLWNGINREATIHKSKAVGEPPLMLANAVHCALTQAVIHARGPERLPDLDAPATAEEILGKLS